MWDPQAANLAPRSRVLRYDCRGFGASGPFDPATPYTHAGDLLALLDHCGIGQAVLAGLSFGGRIVLQAALAAPDRVRRPRAARCRARWRSLGSGVGGRPGRGRPAGQGPRPAGRTGGLAGAPAVRRRPAAARPGRCWRRWSPATRASTGPAMTPTWYRAAAHRRAAYLAVPSLVVVGERDVPCFREMSAVLARRLPGARQEVIAAAGHMVNLEQPAAVNALLGGFLDRLPPMAATGTEGVRDGTSEGGGGAGRACPAGPRRHDRQGGDAQREGGGGRGATGGVP